MISRLLYLMIIGVLLFTVDGLGQNTWLKTFGGSGDEGVNSITTTTDGGYVLTGFTLSNDGGFSGIDKGYYSDIFVIKLDSSGNTVWRKTFGGSNWDNGYSITTTNNLGYILTGKTHSFDGDFNGIYKGGGSDIFVMKLDSNGDIEWKKTFGGIGEDWGSSIINTTDGEYVLTGWTNSNDNHPSGINYEKGDDIFIFKLNSSGDIIWKKTFGGSKNEYSSSIVSTSDGGYVLTGRTSSNDSDFSGMNKGFDDIFVMKLSSVGDTVWKNIFGGSGWEGGNDIYQTTDGGYVLTGGSNDSVPNGFNQKYQDIFVIKLDSIGDIEWNKKIGGGSFDYGSHINQTTDGGYVLTGGFESNDGDFSGMNRGNIDIYVLKLDSNGNVSWKKTFGGSGSEVGISLSTTTDGGYVLTGGTSSNDCDFSGMNKGGSDIFVMKLDSNGNLNNTTSINEFNEPTTTLSVHPNPFSNSTSVSYKVNTPSNVRIELLNTLGQTIEVLREDYTDIGTYQLPLNVSTLSSGMYSVRMRSGSMNEVVPVWVVR